MKVLETEWIKYRNAVVPKDAGSAQLTDTRRAFFAGAWALYVVMMERLDPEHEPTERDMNFMAALDAEMRTFADRVKKGWA